LDLLLRLDYYEANRGTTNKQKALGKFLDCWRAKLLRRRHRSDAGHAILKELASAIYVQYKYRRLEENTPIHLRLPHRAKHDVFVVDPGFTFQVYADSCSLFAGLIGCIVLEMLSRAYLGNPTHSLLSGHNL